MSDESSSIRGNGPPSDVTGEQLWGPNWTDRDLHQLIINKTSHIVSINNQINVLMKEQERHEADINKVWDELRIVDYPYVPWEPTPEDSRAAILAE